MQPLRDDQIHQLAEGEFYLPYYNTETLKNELAPLIAIYSGILVISGPVGTGRTHLLQAFATHKQVQGLNVLLIAHEHNEIQGIDTLIFRKTDWREPKAGKENVDTMLARIDAINPDVVVFDDMNYSEILAMANTLAARGVLVLGVVYSSSGDIVSHFDRISGSDNSDSSENQEDLISGHVNIRHSLIRTVKANAETRFVASILKP